VSELEARLAALEVEWPETPDVAAGVRRRLASEVRPETAAGRAFAGGRRRLAVAVAAFLVALGGVMAVPSARSTVFDWLGIGGETIRRVPEAPTPTPTPLDLGERIALPDDAVVPAALGRPDAAYRAGEIVTLLYRPRAGLPESGHTGAGALVSQFPGRVGEELVRKLAGPDTTIEAVTVAGEPGYWLAGAAHGLIYEDPSGQIREAPMRLAGPTLVWRRGELTLRLEADIPKERALAIARSVR
jgi:hypothetical protein